MYISFLNKSKSSIKRRINLECKWWINRKTSRTISNCRSVFLSILYNENISIKKTLNRSIGTFARALDCPTALKHPSLHMSAASASRDATLVRLISCFLSLIYFLIFSFLLWIHYINITMI